MASSTCGLQCRSISEHLQRSAAAPAEVEVKDAASLLSAEEMQELKGFSSFG